MNFHQAYKSTLIPEMTDHQIVSGLNDLHNLYTTQRKDLKEDLLTEQMVSSYSLFYLLTNMPKLDFVFQKLPSFLQQKLLELPLMDIGTGPGTYLWPLFDLGRNGQTCGVDRSRLMLSQAEKLRSDHYPDHEIIWSQNIPKTFPQNGILLFGNSINEIGVSKVINLVEKFQPEIVLWIEPGTRELSFDLLKIRDFLGTQNFKIAYPCATINGQCPMLKRGEEAWCHQIIRMTHEPEVERISQIAKLDRKSMPMNAHIYFKKNGTENTTQDTATMVRFLTETKHSFEWEVCLEKDQTNQLLVFEIPKRDLSKSQLKNLQKESVGIKFSYQSSKILSEHKWRIKLIDYPHSS